MIIELTQGHCTKLILIFCTHLRGPPSTMTRLPISADRQVQRALLHSSLDITQSRADLSPTANLRRCHVRPLQLFLIHVAYSCWCASAGDMRSISHSLLDMHESLRKMLSQDPAPPTSLPHPPVSYEVRPRQDDDWFTRK